MPRPTKPGTGRPPRPGLSDAEIDAITPWDQAPDAANVPPLLPGQARAMMPWGRDYAAYADEGIDYNCGGGHDRPVRRKRRHDMVEACRYLQGEMESMAPAVYGSGEPAGDAPAGPGTSPDRDYWRNKSPW